MDSVLRAAAMYLALMVLFKIAGRRSMAELTTFYFLLLMIIGEATQQALLGDDFPLTNAMLVIVTLIAIDVGLSLLKQRSGWISRLIDGEPTIIHRREWQAAASATAPCPIGGSGYYEGRPFQPGRRNAGRDQVRDH